MVSIEQSTNELRESTINQVLDFLTSMSVDDLYPFLPIMLMVENWQTLNAARGTVSTFPKDPTFKIRDIMSGSAPFVLRR